jgi:hypothetical protein
MCDMEKCSQSLIFHSKGPDGLYFRRPFCGQVFLVPKDKIKLERYEGYGSEIDCNQCMNSLTCCVPSYDNGFIFRCICCGKFYRLTLFDFVYVSGKPICI